MQIKVRLNQSPHIVHDDYQLHTWFGALSGRVLGDHFEAYAIDENGNTCTVVWSIAVRDESEDYDNVNWDFPDEVITDDGTVYNPDFTVIDWKNSKS